MAVIRISRPKRDWSVSPATVLPVGLLVRLFGFHFSFTVVLDQHAAGKIGNGQIRVFMVDSGEHRVRVRLLRLRRSDEVRMTLMEDEERDFLCGSNGIGWPTLQEASPEEAAQIRRSSTAEPPKPGDHASPT